MLQALTTGLHQKAIDARWYHLGAYLLVLASTPIFFGLIFGTLVTLDQMHEKLEVAKFIRDHQQVVDRYRTRDDVYSLALHHQPRQTHILQITCDVEDLATFDDIRGELRNVNFLQASVVWDYNVRAEEGYHSDRRLPSMSLGLLGERLGITVISAIGALLSTLVLSAGCIVALDRFSQKSKNYLVANADR